MLRARGRHACFNLVGRRSGPHAQQEAYVALMWALPAVVASAFILGAVV